MGGPFGSTVLGTTNVLMAAVLADGVTIIESAACEPEVEDLVDVLNAMGAKITGGGTPRLRIKGVEALGGVEHTIIPDRIEAGTFMMAAAITGGEVNVRNARIDHLYAVVDKLRDAGLHVESAGGGLTVAAGQRLTPVDVTTHPYPGFPTDLQAQLMALLCLVDGNSAIIEKIFPDRYMHMAELLRLGANIRKEGPVAIITGVESFVGAPVMASDLRASAALVLAGMAGRGETEVRRVYHIDRGYERIEEKLRPLGAKIQRTKE
ncbi:MAG: UDP-N-acetylglucosamine 1-carboxyvinyltransferase, partial [Phycisphaerae bacterium]|nr:UDP-N-acetylglucosamine 1-carboxyvinyltransferase [Phycisphaerae bacterium]